MRTRTREEAEGEEEEEQHRAGIARTQLLVAGARSESESLSRQHDEHRERVISNLMGRRAELNVPTMSRDAVEQLLAQAGDAHVPTLNAPWPVPRAPESCAWPGRASNPVLDGPWPTRQTGVCDMPHGGRAAGLMRRQGGGAFPDGSSLSASGH